MLASSALVRGHRRGAGGRDAPRWSSTRCASPPHGHPLLTDDAVAVMVERLLPRATVLTPNLHEVRRLTGVEVRTEADLDAAARGPASRLGPALGAGQGRPPRRRRRPWTCSPTATPGCCCAPPGSTTVHTHGTGCTLASAVAARLAHGDDVPTAVTGRPRPTSPGAVAARVRPRRGPRSGPPRLAVARSPGPDLTRQPAGAPRGHLRPRRPCPRRPPRRLRPPRRDRHRPRRRSARARRSGRRRCCAATTARSRGGAHLGAGRHGGARHPRAPHPDRQRRGGRAPRAPRGLHHRGRQPGRVQLRRAAPRGRAHRRAGRAPARWSPTTWRCRPARWRSASRRRSARTRCRRGRSPRRRRSTSGTAPATRDELRRLD